MVKYHQWFTRDRLARKIKKRKKLQASSSKLQA